MDFLYTTLYNMNLQFIDLFISWRQRPGRSSYWPRRRMSGTKALSNFSRRGQGLNHVRSSGDAMDSVPKAERGKKKWQQGPGGPVWWRDFQELRILEPQNRQHATYDLFGMTNGGAFQRPPSPSKPYHFWGLQILRIQSMGRYDLNLMLFSGQQCYCRRTRW